MDLEVSFLFEVLLCYLTLSSQACFFKSRFKDHKVSICISLMCMMVSCFCTYCLQEGIINMKVHLSLLLALMHMGKIHVTHYLLCHVVHSHVFQFYHYMIAHMLEELMQVTCSSKALLTTIHVIHLML